MPEHLREEYGLDRAPEQEAPVATDVSSNSSSGFVTFKVQQVPSLDQSQMDNSSMDQSRLSRSSFVLTTNSGTDKTHYSSQTATTFENLLPDDSVMIFDSADKVKKISKKKKKKGSRAKRAGISKDTESEKAGGRRK